MKTIIEKIKEFWRKKVYARQLKKAIKQANRIKMQTGQKCFVVDIDGQPHAFTKRELKGAQKAGYISKHINLEAVEKAALYNTL